MVPVRSFSPAVEDYLKAIYRLQVDCDEPVTTTALGGWLAVTPSSASGMLRKLDDLHLISYTPYRGVRLSASGLRAALAVVRRHRLLEAFLAETVGLSWDQVHEEAEALEHGLSAHLAEAIAARLGDPRTDPHGDPIPTRDGRVVETPSMSLRSLGPRRRGRIVRVSDRDPVVLRLLSERGIGLGDTITVTGLDSGGGAAVETRSGPHLFDAHVVAAIRVAAGRADVRREEPARRRTADGLSVEAGRRSGARR